MNSHSKKKKTLPTQPSTTREPYFVENIIQNQPIFIANSQKPVKKSTKRKSSTKKHKHIKGLHEDLSSSCGMLTRRIYGSLDFNHQSNVQFNNRCSMKDNVIVSDALMINQAKKNRHIEEQEKILKERQEMFRKQAVDLKEYYNHFRKSQISDAYVNILSQKSILQDKKLQRLNKDILKEKIQSKESNLCQGVSPKKLVLSSGKNNNKICSQQAICLPQIQQLQELKERYSHTVVPELMGTLSPSLRNTHNTFNTQSLKQHDFNSPTKLSRLTNEKDPKASKCSLKSPIQIIKSVGSRKLVGNTSVQTEKIAQNSERALTSRENSHLQSINEINSNNLISTQNLLKDSISTNASSLMKVLQKSKSTEDFMQKQRVKVIKQAFILNWRQGNGKKQEKYATNNPCKYTEHLKTERQKVKNQEQKQMTRLKYGEEGLKKNPLEMPESESTNNKYILGYDSLKEYQMKFEEIAKNKIKSCIVAKN